MNATPSRPAWREPLVWLVIALPAASVIAGIITLVIAIRTDDNDPVRDEVQRTAQIQQVDLSAHQHAADLGYVADIEMIADRQLSLHFADDAPGDQQLLLQLMHPSHAADDRQLLLMRDGECWRSADAISREHDWVLRLTPLDGSWRIGGRLGRDATQARLEPGLARP